MKTPFALTVLLYTVFSATVSAAELTEYSATYTASANGLKANAKRSLYINSDGHYQLDNALVAEFAGTELASLNESSTFILQDSMLQPQSYNYRLSGLGREAKSIAFDWDAQVAVSAEDLESWVLQLQTDTQDPLSYQAALQLLLTDSNLTDVSWPIINGDKIEIERYRIEGEEILETPVGPLNCMLLIRVRDDNSKSTRIWLAKDRAFLLTKIEQINSSGVRIVLELESAIVNGEALAN